MRPKLYYHPLSTFSRRVRIVFAEKQIPHELSLVDMAARRHREQPYLSLNPYGRVPTLEEDGFVLFESTAILNYLEATWPTPPLVPADARGGALVDMHMKLCDLQLTRYRNDHFPQTLSAQRQVEHGCDSGGQGGDREALCDT
jgi:glutathione S-transferase